jgi:hypothetical protein
MGVITGTKCTIIQNHSSIWEGDGIKTYNELKVEREAVRSYG